jgi:serine/threonine protein kinase
MSPEQIKGDHLDPRSDIYSMGCMIFELVSGKAPYTANTPNELLNKHVSASIPSLLVNNDNVSSEFNSVVRKMLAKKPEDRPQDMWDVLKMVRATPIFKKESLIF